MSIGDARFEPFFAAAESSGAAVFVHALRPAGQERIVGAFTEQAVCFPGDIALAAASMITGGIAARHPELRIAFSHGGGALSMLLPRLVHAWNALPKAKQSLAESPAVYARRFFYDALVFDPTATRFIIDSFGSSQICVGSDYPFNMGTATRWRAGEIRAGRRVIAAITSANARRFLGCSPRETQPRSYCCGPGAASRRRNSARSGSTPATPGRNTSSIRLRLRLRLLRSRIPRFLRSYTPGFLRCRILRFLRRRILRLRRHRVQRLRRRQVFRARSMYTGGGE